MSKVEVDIDAIIESSKEKARWARARFGQHPSAEFACCRLTEEVGELVQAATATSKGRDKNRTKAILEEAVDVIAMTIRLLEEYPDGMP